jgi:4-hydroxy 2-oxovalerate aldolase
MTKLYDVTLRDGNHALRHGLELQFVTKYCSLADKSGVWAIEVGHGNGLGASSYLVGKSRYSDFELLSAARNSIKNSKLAVHSIPGFSTIRKDLREVFRVASHVTEANVSATHINFLKSEGVIVHGVLMMSHMIDVLGLIDQCKLLEKYGVDAVVLMDSAGSFDPMQIRKRVESLRQEVAIDIGVHAHNNLSVGVANALAAMETGAEILDGATMALGAGAGNAQLEAIAFHLNRANEGNYNLTHFLRMSDLVATAHRQSLPLINGSSIASGNVGAFSGYAPLVKDLAMEFSLEIYDLWLAIGEKKLVAGQESQLREIAMTLKESKSFE